MVLFLFVIMLLGTERLRSSSTLPWQQPAAIILGIALLLEAAYVLFFRAGVPSTGQPLPDGFGGPASMGNILFNQYLLPFEVTSILLLVAMVGAIVLTRRNV
jgi:NADH-quinone oxidoreductase subunit J